MNFQLHLCFCVFKWRTCERRKGHYVRMYFHICVLYVCTSIYVYYMYVLPYYVYYIYTSIYVYYMYALPYVYYIHTSIYVY